MLVVWLFIADGWLFGDDWWLRVGWCSGSVVWCLLVAGCWSVDVDCRLLVADLFVRYELWSVTLLVVCWWLFGVGCVMLIVGVWLLVVDRWLWVVV